MNEIQRVRKIIKWSMALISFLSSWIVFILIVALILIGGIASATKSKQEQEAMMNSNVLPNGLTEFSYFCIYESGGENLYNAVLGDGGRAFGA